MCCDHAIVSILNQDYIWEVVRLSNCNLQFNILKRGMHAGTLEARAIYLNRKVG